MFVHEIFDNDCCSLLTEDVHILIQRYYVELRASEIEIRDKEKEVMDHPNISTLRHLTIQIVSLSIVQITIRESITQLQLD